MTQAVKRGAFILFEGVDRSGKSTQCAQLMEHLKAAGVNAELWKFPDRTTTIGKLINGFLANINEIDDAAVHLLFSANRHEKAKDLEKKLQEGVTLVVDRYAYSGVAYTAAKRIAPLDLQWCRQPDSGLPAPDVVFYLRLPPESARSRGGYGEERYEKVEFQARVAACFEQMMDARWCVLDATQGVDQVHQQVVDKVQEVLRRCEQGPVLGRLWEEQPVAEPGTAAAAPQAAAPQADKVLEEIGVNRQEVVGEATDGKSNRGLLGKRGRQGDEFGSMGAAAGVGS